jgi:hypothetical protein
MLSLGDRESRRFVPIRQNPAGRIAAGPQICGLLGLVETRVAAGTWRSDVKSLRRLMHAFFGHKSVKVYLADAPWVARCDCGYELRVKEFSLGRIGAGPGEATPGSGY